MQRALLLRVRPSAQVFLQLDPAAKKALEAMQREVKAVKAAVEAARSQVRGLSHCPRKTPHGSS